MDKITLNNSSVLDFNKSNGLNITIEKKTIDELETLLTTENLSKVEFSNYEKGVYGNYTNLKCLSISKFLADGSIVVNLKETDAS